MKSKLFFIVTIVTFLLFTGCPQEPKKKSDSSPLDGYWKLDSIKTYDSNNNLIDNLTFPMDWIAVYRGETQNVNYDLDGDGENESVTYNVYIGVENSVARIYADVKVTDPGDSLNTYLSDNSIVPTEEGLPFLADEMRYNSSKDITLSISGTSVTGSGDTNASFTIDQGKLYITTPGADNTTIELTFSSLSSLDSADAVEDISLVIF